MKSITANSEFADPILHRLYWGLMMSDICHKLGIPKTKENTERLHEFHKKELGYETISGRSQEVVSKFLFEVTVFWAVEKGIFVRTSSKQPFDIENRSLSEIIHLL